MNVRHVVNSKNAVNTVHSAPFVNEKYAAYENFSESTNFFSLLLTNPVKERRFKQQHD